MANSQTIDSAGTGTQTPRDNFESGEGITPSVFSIPGKFIFRGLVIEIKRIFVDGKELFFGALQNDIPVTSGDKVRFEGSGLRVYQKVSFLVGSGVEGDGLVEIPCTVYREGTILEFTVPDLTKNNIVDSSHPFLKLIGNRELGYYGASRVISPYLTFFTKKQEEKEKDTERGEGEEKGGEGYKRKRASGAGDSIGPTGLIFKTAEELAQEAGKIFTDRKPASAQASATGASAPLGTGAKAKISAESDGGSDGGDIEIEADAQEETIGQVRENLVELAGSAGKGVKTQVDFDVNARAAASSRPETIRQSAQILGEYIDKNPSSVINAQVRGEIQTALSSGNVQNLSLEGKQSLGKVVAQIQQDQNLQGSGQLQPAAAAISAELQASGTTSKAGAGEAVGAQGAEVSGQAGTQVSAGGAVQVDGGLEAEIKASAGPQEPRGEDAQAGQASVPSLGAGRAGMEALGEYIYNNPSAIINSPDRQEILQALATGDPQNLKKLTPGAKNSLNGLLNRLKNGQVQAPKEVLSAAENLGPKIQGPVSEAAGGPPENTEGAEEPESLGESKQPPGGLRGTINKFKENEQALGKRLGGLAPGLSVPGSPTEPKTEAGAKRSPGPGGDLPAQKTIDSAAPKNEAEGKQQTEDGGPEKSRAGDESGQPLAEPLPSEADRENRGSEMGSQAAQGGLPQKPLGSENAELPENDDSAEEDTESGEAEETQSIVQSTAASAAGGLSTSAKINEAEKLLSKVLNANLNRIALIVWGAALPTWFLSVVIGAIAGDLIWVLKNMALRIVANAAKRWIGTNSILTKGLSEQDLGKLKIDLSWTVKLHILAMNAVVGLIILAIAVITISFIWATCKSVVTWPWREISGFQAVCEGIGKGVVGSALNNFTPAGSFSGSYNVPGTLAGTSQWTAQINTSAQKWNVDACILRVVVQKESGGHPTVIGCDCRFNGRPDLCQEPATTRFYYTGYRFNWDSCSYGIGLTQWTIYPRGGAGFKAWQNDATPSRQIAGQWYTASQLLDPLTSLDLTAKVFSQNLAKANGNVASAFAAYVGQSSYTQRFVDERMALYNMCKAGN